MDIPVGAAKSEFAELTRHKDVLIERLAIETGRYERIALEDHIEATERLIEGINAALAAEQRELTESTSGADPRALSPGKASALSDLYDDQEASHATR